MFQIIRGLLESNVDESRILYVNLESNLLVGCAPENLRRMLDVSTRYTENIQVYVSGSS